MANAKWGVNYNADTLALDEILHFASMAEEAGADCVWTAEGWRDAFVPLAAITTVAKRLRVGTAIAQIARPPVLTALSALSLAELTGGKKIRPRRRHRTENMEPELAWPGRPKARGADSRIHRMHSIDPESNTG